MKTTVPMISVITPSYNQGQYIEATIQSVLNQSYSNIEYIVIDGGSTDGTIEILKKYDGSLKWISEKDNGPEDAINKGFGMAQGDIFAWLASDDVFETDSLQKAMDVFCKQPDVAMVYGRCQYIDRNGDVIGECPTEPFNYEYLAVYNFVAQPSAFFRRSAYEDAGGISLTLRQASDYDLWIRLTKNRKVIYLSDFLSSYRLHYAAKTLGFHDPAVKFEEYILLTLKYYSWAPANRVYPCCLYRLKAKFFRFPSTIITIFSLIYATFEYIRLNKGIDCRDLALIPRNIKKLLFGWELEDAIKFHSDNLIK
jgi:glycosyltransferase involved in cell wall biosynthesis